MFLKYNFLKKQNVLQYNYTKTLIFLVRCLFFKYIINSINEQNKKQTDTEGEKQRNYTTETNRIKTNLKTYFIIILYNKYTATLL